MNLSVRKTVLIFTCVLIVGVIVAGTNYGQRPQFYPYLAMQAGEPLEVQFIQHGIPDGKKCEARVKRMANAMLSTCVECTIVEARCLEKLNPRQRELLSGQPVDIPTMRMPRGVVAFISNAPTLANEVCRESERQGSFRTGPVRCIAAGVASTTASFTTLDESVETNLGLGFNATFGLILLAATLSLIISYLVVRSGRLSGSLTRNATANTRTIGVLNDLPAGKIIKLCLDLFLAVVLLAILSPLLVLIALLILVLEGRPIFYISRRHISALQTALIFKFRTMVRDATDPTHRLNERFMRDGFLDIPLSCEIYTPIGRFLERTQLVETPQLLNIIFDGLSFVGNRPLPAANVTHLKASLAGWAERFDSPAGITGIAQVVGRRNLTPSERIELESLYSRVFMYGNILKCDIKIILFTVRVVLFADGITVSQARELLLGCLPIWATSPNSSPQK